MIDHQYAKFAARYGILVDYAILKSMIFDEFVDFVDFVEDGRKISKIGRTDRSYFGKIGRTDKNSRVKSTEFGKIDRIW